MSIFNLIKPVIPDLNDYRQLSKGSIIASIQLPSSNKNIFQVFIQDNYGNCNINESEINNRIKKLPYIDISHIIFLEKPIYKLGTKIRNLDNTKSGIIVKIVDANSKIRYYVNESGNKNLPSEWIMQEFVELDKGNKNVS